MNNAPIRHMDLYRIETSVQRHVLPGHILGYAQRQEIVARGQRQREVKIHLGDLTGLDRVIPRAATPITGIVGKQQDAIRRPQLNPEDRLVAGTPEAHPCGQLEPIEVSTTVSDEPEDRLSSSKSVIVASPVP